MNHVHHRMQVRDSVTFTCPFCDSGTITAGIDDDDCGVVLHTMPYCHSFIVKEPDVFLKEARGMMRARTLKANKKKS